MTYVTETAFQTLQGHNPVSKVNESFVLHTHCKSVAGDPGRKKS